MYNGKIKSNERSLVALMDIGKVQSFVQTFFFHYKYAQIYASRHNVNENTGNEPR